VRILLITDVFFDFLVGLFGAGSDKNGICQLFGAFRVPIIGGFGRLTGIVEFDSRRYLKS